MSDYKLYELSPNKNWVIFDIDTWHNTLKNGKNVEFVYKNKYEMGSFYISLTEAKKNELLEQDKILINESLYPNYSFNLGNEIELGGKIINKHTYTEEEKKEIHRLLYFDIREAHKYEPNSSYIWNSHILRANNWIHHPAYFFIRDGGCNIKLVPEDDDNEIKPYILRDAEINTSFSNELWNINLKNGKIVEYEINKIYEHIRSKVEVTEKRKRILENDNNPNFASPKIILNDVSGCSVNDLTNLFSVNETITNEENYNEEEKKEIHHLLYFDKDDENSYDPDCDCNVKDTILKANGWSIINNEFGVCHYNGCHVDKEHIDNGLENPLKLYKLENKYNNTLYSIEYIDTKLKNGKYVEYQIQTNYVRGIFKIELSEQDKKELLKKDEMILSDISNCCFFKLDTPYEIKETLINKQEYTEEEKKEIHQLLYFDKDDENSYEPDCDCNVKDTILKANGWCIDENDITYGISSGGCILKKMNEFYYGNDPFSQEFI